MSTDDSPPSILAKAFAVLETFDSNRRVLSLTDIARRSGLPKSTVHRLLARLTELGAIEHHNNGYRIGLSLFRIGITPPAISMRDLATPVLAALYRSSGMPVALAVLRQFDVIILESVHLPYKPAGASVAGSRFPANCTALGKVLLAHEDLDDLDAFLPRPMPELTPASVTEVEKLIAQLHEVRASGLAHEAGEAQIGLACVAAPVMMMGVAVGAVSVAHPVSSANTREFGLAAREAASQIGRMARAEIDEGRISWFPRAF